MLKAYQPAQSRMPNLATSATSPKRPAGPFADRRGDMIRRHLIEQGGFYRSRRYRIGQYAGLRQFLADRLGQGKKAGLGCTIGKKIGRSVLARQ